MSTDNPFDPPRAEVRDQAAFDTLSHGALVTPPAMEHVVSIWWSLLWRATLASTVGGAIAGGVGGAVVAVAGHMELAGRVGTVLGWLISIPLSLWALRAALKKPHKGMTVVLLRRDS